LRGHHIGKGASNLLLFLCFVKKAQGRVKEWGRMDEEGSGETKEEED
jgi:hypothetical protein